MIMERGARPDALPKPKRAKTAFGVVGVGVGLALGLGREGVGANLNARLKEPGQLRGSHE